MEYTILIHGGAGVITHDSPEKTVIYMRGHVLAIGDFVAWSGIPITLAIPGPNRLNCCDLRIAALARVISCQEATLNNIPEPPDLSTKPLRRLKNVPKASASAPTGKGAPTTGAIPPKNN
jgi:hypothetical protein